MLVFQSTVMHKQLLSVAGSRNTQRLCTVVRGQTSPYAPTGVSRRGTLLFRDAEPIVRWLDELAQAHIYIRFSGKIWRTGYIGGKSARQRKMWETRLTTDRLPSRPDWLLLWEDATTTTHTHTALFSEGSARVCVVFAASLETGNIIQDATTLKHTHSALFSEGSVFVFVFFAF